MSYLLKYSGCWADQMDVQGIEIISEQDYQFIKNNKNFEFGQDTWFSVGTNQELEYNNVSEWLDDCEIIKITAQQQEIIKRLIGNSYGTTLFESIFERIGE